MKKIKTIIKLILVILALLISFNLRYKNFDKIPFPGESMDEYSYSWVGLSLIKIGMPVGISGLSGYRNTESKYINVDNVFQNTAGGNPLTINWPWFDHPPLLGLITGGFANLKNIKSFEDTNIYIIRKPMIVIGTVSVLLVIILAWIIFNFRTAIISGFIYGTSPVVVISSRMIQGENGVIPFFLLSLIFMALFLKKKKSFWLVISALMAGVASLFKLSGLVALISNLFILFIYRKTFKRDWISYMWQFLIISLSITSLFLMYGITFGLSDFWAIFKSNGSRFYGIGPEALYNLFTQVKITNTKFLTDPVVLCGWISILLLSKSSGQKFGKIFLLSMTISYLALYIILGSYPFGWYAFPFFPMLIIAFSSILERSLSKKEYLISGMVLLIISIGYLLTKFIDINSFQKYATFWKYSLATILFLTMYVQLNHKIKLTGLLVRILLVVLIILLIVMNIRYVLMMNIDYWYKLL